MSAGTRLEVRQSSGDYPVYFGRGVLDDLGAIVDEAAPGRRPVVLAGKGVPSQWVDRVAGAWDVAGSPIRFPDGEADKNLSTIEDLVGALLDGGLRRDAVAVVVGGGTAGDAAGFASAVFMRGIPFVLVPTTLLAQVDSSVGGKLGVNHALGKNMIGVFQAPAAVVSDPVTWSTLPDREKRSGMYEVLKCALIADRDLLFALSEMDPGESGDRIEAAVRRGIEIKADIVSRDERESGDRRLLNYGHTIGHALEAHAGYGVLTHGDAVAWGMIAANAIAVSRGLLDAAESDSVNRLILSWNPQVCEASDVDGIAGLVERDKKFSERGRVMVLPEHAGHCRVVDGITADEIRGAIELVGRYADR